MCVLFHEDLTSTLFSSRKWMTAHGSNDEEDGTRKPLLPTVRSMTSRTPASIYFTRHTLPNPYLRPE
jgi:hypothetical protein